MIHYTFPLNFRSIYEHAVKLYAQGRRDPSSYFDAEQNAWLLANGLNAQAFYDYAEDHVATGEPGYDQALQIETVRRDYFLNTQNSRASTHTADPETWPNKTESVQGIEWLPRILPKARAKLRGELPASLMFGCGGDRRFFKTHDILPAEFLTLVWHHEHDDSTIISWVVNRSAQTRQTKAH